MARTEPPTRVLALGGWGRCGSTLLDMMLGQLPGFVSAGEVRELWLRGCREDRPCGCGAPFSACPFWSEVGRAAFGGWDRLDLERVLRVRYRVDRTWALPRLLSGLVPEVVPDGSGRRPYGSRPAREEQDPDLRHYLDALSRLLAGIAAVAGANVVIDSSKLPTHNLLLQRCPGVDVSIVHLVRDSRGVAYSVRKHVTKTVSHGEPTALPRYGAVRSSLRYDIYNGAHDLLAAHGRLVGRPVLRIRYEDLVDDPRRWLLSAARLADPATPDTLPFLSEAADAVSLAPNHLVEGNPVRFAQGPLPLRVDGAWRTGLPTSERRTVGLLTSPLLARYGYPLRRDDDPTTATTYAAAPG